MSKRYRVINNKISTKLILAKVRVNNNPKVITRAIIIGIKLSLLNFDLGFKLLLVSFSSI